MYTNYVLKTLKPGVFAAIASDEGSAGSNSGIIDLGDETIVFDTSATLSAAKELLEMSKEITGRAPKYVMNSHSHPDHIHGNAMFSETSVIISSTVTRNEIMDHGIESMMNMYDDLSTQLTSLRERLVAMSDLSERVDIEHTIRVFEGVLKDFPKPNDLRVPDLTYGQELVLHGTERSAFLRTYGGAHSACDAVMWLPEDGILFAGDVIGEPILCLGKPENWSKILDSLEAFGSDKIIPGHGDVLSAVRAFEITRHHIDCMFQFAHQALDTVNPLRFAETLEVPSGSNDYWFRKDLRFLIEHLREATDLNI